MKVHFTARGWKDYMWWHETGGPAGLSRVNLLIGDALRHPFTGLGKPEPLRGGLKGFWSRRITSEHRIIYSVAGIGDLQALEIVQCREHY